MKTLRSFPQAASALGLLIVIALAAPGPAAAQPADATTGDADSGRQLFARFGCYACHLYSGAGYNGAPGGAPLVPMRLPEPAFKVYLRNPPVPRRMPPYTADVLSDDEAADLYAFIRSLPEPRAAEEIPLLNDLIEKLNEENRR